MLDLTASRDMPHGIAPLKNRRWRYAPRTGRLRRKNSRATRALALPAGGGRILHTMKNLPIFLKLRKITFKEKRK